jgi:hypothetical protein
LYSTVCNILNGRIYWVENHPWYKKRVRRRRKKEFLGRKSPDVQEEVEKKKKEIDLVENHPILRNRKRRRTLYRKSNSCIPTKGMVRPQSQFIHSCVCERIIYSHDLSAYLAAAKQTDQSWKLYKSLTDM